MIEPPYIPFYKPDGMTDEEYHYEVKKAEERYQIWLEEQEETQKNQDDETLNK